MSKLLSKEDKEMIAVFHNMRMEFSLGFERGWVAKKEYSKQDGVALLKWLLTHNEEITITSGDNVWYVNGEETSHEKLYEIYKSQL